MTDPVRRVAVHGGGIAPAMAALAIARAYGRLGVEVSWIDTGEMPAPHEALIAPPDLASFHRLLGIEDAALARATSATFNMGQQFVGWSGGEDAFLHAYGDAGTPFGGFPFIQHWIRARQAGLRVALEDFCLAAAAAKQGRIGQPQGGEMRQAVKHGWHLDAAGYAALLRASCERAGVRIVAGRGTAVVADGRVTGIALDGETIDADLIVDADGALIAALDPDGLTSDSAVCDRIIRTSVAPFDPVPLFSRVSAHAAGWTTLIPLADRTAVEFVYDSAQLSDTDASAQFGADAETLSVTARARPWVGNVVAIGEAAGSVLPLDGADLLLLQLMVAQLVLLWPVDRTTMPEADIYNEELTGSRASVTDFAAQHFSLNGRREPFWEAARATPRSPILASKIDLFAARGMFAHYNYEAYVEDSWALCMTGHGITPTGFDPQALGVPDQDLMTEFQRQLRAIAADVRGMDTHADALRRLRA